jgi:glycosyltransferase involved in cell wall biosynthesis
VRVLHVIPSIAPRYGGPSVAIEGMAAGLASLGFDVTVATTDADGAGRLDVPTSQPVLRDKVTYRFFHRSLPGEWKYSRPLGHWIRDNVKGFEIVHVHGMFIYTTIPSCRGARAARVPYIIRPLGTLDPWSMRRHRWKKRPYYRLIEHAHLAKAAAVHCTSKAEGAAVAELGFPSLVSVVPLGVEIPEATQHTRSDSSTVSVIFLSRLDPKKGLPILIDAMSLVRSQNPHVRLIVVGSGESTYRRAMEAHCHDRGLSDIVHFKGHLSGTAKLEALRSADIFVLPSYQENFGIAVVEAMAAELPVVVSPQVGIAEEIQTHGAGLVSIIKAEMLAAAIQKLVDNGSLRRQMGAAGRRLVQERYSWPAVCSELVELYQRAIDRRTVQSSKIAPSLS